MRLSIIIPCSQNDSPENLISSITSKLPEDSSKYEIIAVSSSKIPSTDIHSKNTIYLTSKVENRSIQLNQGAQAAKGQWLWFLHADSSLNTSAYSELSELVFDESPAQRSHESCYYFKLSFGAKAPILCKINSLLANIRSKLFQRPFGDQGLLIGKNLFEKHGPFSLEFDSGEDHAFMLTLINSKVPIKGLDSYIETSPRRYENNGWFSTTLHHLKLSIKQERSKRGVKHAS